MPEALAVVAVGRRGVADSWPAAAVGVARYTQEAVAVGTPDVGVVVAPGERAGAGAHPPSFHMTHKKRYRLRAVRRIFDNSFRPTPCPAVVGRRARKEGRAWNGWWPARFRGSNVGIP
jgi:hypothetical protein